MNSPTNRNPKDQKDQKDQNQTQENSSQTGDKASDTQPAGPNHLPQLRTLLLQIHPRWKMTQFAPHEVYKDVEEMRKAIGEMQDVLCILIDRINHCKDC